MKKSTLFLALLLLVSFGGCTRDEDLDEVLTKGTWKVGDIVERGDDETSKFFGYVFTFLPNGTVTVARPNLPDAVGTWDEHDGDTRLDLEFGQSGLLEKLNDDWVVDFIEDDEVGLHESGAPFNQVRFDQR